MLRFIKGASGTGKSDYIKEEIIKLSDSLKKAILIVPEQFSFEAEREYYELLGTERSENVKVLSFERLTDDVFRLYGGVAGNYANNTIELLTMKLALQECKDKLHIYKKNSVRPDFIMSMLNTARELKNAGIDFDTLYEKSLTADDALLKDKLFDFSLIFGSYEALLKQSFLNPSDRLLTAKKLISENGYFKGYNVYFDEFSNFTGIQKEIIKLALEQSDEVSISLCIPEGDTEYGLFDVLKGAEKSIKALANKVGAKISIPVVLNNSKRFLNEELYHFGKEVLKNNPAPFSKPNNAVSCFGLTNEFDEVDFVASQIWELVQKDGYRFEDIVVIGRDFDTYGYIIESVFEKYQIPYFFDCSEKIDATPLMRFISHLIGTVVTGMSKKELIPMIKCGLLPFTLTEIDDFEKYIYVWNIDKDYFKKQFKQNPIGFSERPLQRKELRKLKNAEKVRSFCVELIENFKALAEENNSISYAIYQILQSLSLQTVITQRINTYNSEGKIKEAEDEKRVWDVLMELLDALETSLKEHKLNYREYKEMFLLTASCYNLEHRPQTLDSVLVGSAERVRVSGKKATIIIGANDKVFPFVPTSGGLITEEERKKMSEYGLSLQNFSEENLIDERFVTYKALTCSSDRLVITFSLGDISGHEKYPSVLVTGFGSIFPDTPIIHQKDLGKDFFCRNLPTAFHQVAKVGKNASDANAVFYATAKELFKGEKAYLNKLRKLEKSLKEETKLSNTSLCTELFSRPLVYKGERNKRVLLSKKSDRRYLVKEQDKLLKLHHRVTSISPSQVEKYYTCPFSYFCRYGLRLYTPQKAELNALNRGNVIHYILDKMVRNNELISLSYDEIKEKVNLYLDEYLDVVMGGEKDKSQKFLYFYRRLRLTLFRVFCSLKDEFAQSKFRVVGIEEQIKENGKIMPISIEIADNHNLTISGKIDRVDCYESEEGNFVRIVDYKSGHKEFDLSQMAEGLNLQMLLYLFAIWRTDNDKYSNVSPAGILYMPVGNPTPNLDRGEEDKEQKNYVMSGLLLSDNRVLCAMEKDLGGKYLPIYQKKEELKGKHLATMEEFKAIEKYTKELVLLMGKGLLSGNIAPDPIMTGQNPPCVYCEYNAVCGRELTEPCRTVTKRTMEDIVNA